MPSREDDEYEELSKVSYNELVLLLFDAEKQKLKGKFQPPLDSASALPVSNPFQSFTLTTIPMTTEAIIRAKTRKLENDL